MKDTFIRLVLVNIETHGVKYYFSRLQISLHLVVRAFKFCFCFYFSYYFIDLFIKGDFEFHYVAILELNARVSILRRRLPWACKFYTPLFRTPPWLRRGKGAPSHYLACGLNEPSHYVLLVLHSNTG